MVEKDINPLTGISVGGSASVEEINPETNLSVPMNPLTGKAVGVIQTPTRSYIGGDKGQARSVGAQMLDSQKSVRMDESISKFTDYGVPLGQDLDWQELRARKQGTAEKWGHGLAKAGATTLGAVAENTIGVIFGLGELATGGAYYDNVIGKAVDSTNEWLREEMPNYRTNEEQGMSTMSKLGTANFWADTVANGLGYSIGSIATMWLTGGGGLITKGISGAAKGLGIYKASKAVINGTKLADKLSKGSGFVRSAQMLEAGALMSLSEASVEARETQKGVYSDLVADYLQNNNDAESEGDIDIDKLKEFEDVSFAAGNTNFVSQLPILMGSNLLMFSKQISGFKAASRGASKDVAFDATTKKAVSSLADQSFMKQALGRSKSTALNALEEAGQEGFQYASGHFASSYHTDKYHNGGYGDMSKSLLESMEETFGSQEGLESMLVGALTGGLMGSAQSTLSGEYSTRKTNAETLTKFINGGYLRNVESQYQTAAASTEAMNEMSKHLEAKDIKKFKDAQFKLISLQAYEALERGGFDVMMEKLEDAKGLDPAQFMEHFGYQTKDKAGNTLTLEDQTGGKNQSQVIDNLKTKLEHFKTVYDNVGEQFPLDDRATGLPGMLMSAESREAEKAVHSKKSALRTELVLRGASVMDRTKRMESIHSSLRDILTESLANQYRGTVLGKGKGVKGKELLVELDKAFEEYLSDTSEDGSGDIFNAKERFLSTSRALEAIVNKFSKIDAIAANKFRDATFDYLTLLTDNVIAIDSYNKLSSDEYSQEQFELARVKAEEAAKAKAVDVKVDEAIKNAETSADLKAAMPPKGYSDEAQARSNVKYAELRAAEKAASNEFYKSSLEELESLDKEKLSKVELAGLKDAIEIKKGQKEKSDREHTATAEDGSSLEFQWDVENKIDDSKEAKSNPEYEKVQKETDEAFTGNMGGVEIISDDGRSFQIEGEEYHNIEPNTLDAVSRDKDGNITSIKLVNANGEFTSIFGPENRVDAIAYAILMAEHAKVDGYQELSKEEILEKILTFEEEIAVEVSTVGDRGKHGLKTSELVREEIYSLERGLQEALEAFDQLRTYFIQEAGATKEDLNNDPDLKNLKRKVNSIRSQIGARKRILKMRKEDTTPSDSAILKVERKALAKIEELKETLSKSISDVEATKAEALEAEKLVESTKAADDAEAYTTASKEHRLLLKMIEEAEKVVKSTKRKINYHKKKLKRLEDEESKELPGDGKQAAPEDTGTTEGQNPEGKDTSVGAKPKEKKTDLSRVTYEKKGKTGVYYVSLDSEGEVQVYTDESTTPIVFKKGQEGDRLKIIGKWYVKTGNASVIPHGGKQFIVIQKGATKNGKTAIIQEDGTYVNMDIVKDDLKKKLVFDAIIKEANKRHAARVADKATPTSDQALEKIVVKDQIVETIVFDSEESEGTPGTAKKDVNPLDDVFGPQQTVEEHIAESEGKVVETITFDAEAKDESKPINIYSTEKENAELSNFAPTEFQYKGTEYTSIEEAFQVAKKDFFNTYEIDPADSKTTPQSNQKKVDKWVQDIFNAPTSAAKKKAGRARIPGVNLETAAWDKASPGIMKAIMLEAFKQDKSRLDLLLSTGNATLTHKYKGKEQDGGRFSKILMEVRDELSNKSVKSGATVTFDAEVKAVTFMYSPVDMSGYGKSYKQGDITEGGKSVIFNSHKSTAKVKDGVVKVSIDDVDGKTFYPISVDLSSTTEYADYKKKVEELNAERQRLTAAGEKGIEDMLRGMGASASLAKKNLLDLIGEELKKKNKVTPYKGGKLSNKSVTATPKAKTTFGVKAAKDTYVIMEDSTDQKGNPVRRSKLEVDVDGNPTSHDPDMLDGEPIPIDKSILVHAMPLQGQEVTFEIIVNDYAKESEDRQTPAQIPIYYKINGEIVGKLESGSSNERAMLVAALQRGEEVTMKISDVIAGNFNHARTSDGSKYFSNPEDVFDNPILVFTEVVDDHPQWTLGPQFSSKGVTPKMTLEIFEADNTNVDNGQVGIVVRQERNPQGKSKIAMASTANLAPIAQRATVKLMKEGKFEEAAEIIASSLYSDSANWSTSFLQFGLFKTKAGFMVYKSPSTGELIRITAENFILAGKGKTYSADVVELTGDGQAFTKSKVAPKDFDIIDDITNFVKIKKYHVDRNLGNSQSSYTSPVTGLSYETYQKYLFAAEEIGDPRTGSGKIHRSILTTDMVEMDGSLMHNPQIEFDGGTLKESSPEGKAEKNTAKADSTSAAEEVYPKESEGMNFGNDINKNKIEEENKDCFSPF